MDNMIHTLNKVTLRNQHKVPKKIKIRRAALASKRTIKQDRPEKKLDESRLKRSHFGLLAIFIFTVTFYLSSFLPLSSLSTPTLPLKTLHELNLLAANVSELMLEGSDSTTKIEKLLTQKYKGVTQLDYRIQEIISTNEIIPHNDKTEFLSQIGNTVSFQIPVGRDGTQGILIVTQDISPFAKKPFWIRLLISGSVALLIVALLVYKQTRLITDQVDVLCQHFVKYRRENETGDLYSPQTSDASTLIGQRIGVLEELWTRFQSMQDELAQNVEELEDSKLTLEQTVTDLQLAKKKEQRLVELGNTVAEFGHDIRNANGSISSFATLLIKILDKDRIQAMEVVQALTYIRRIKNSSNNVTGLTTDILDFASGRMEIRPEIYQLDEFQEQIESQLGFIENFPLHYRVPAGQPAFLLRFDGRKIIRVIVNLIKNSWEKFQDTPDTKDGKPAQIEVRFIPQSMRELKIQIVDNGSPIPDSIIANLFQSFQTEGKLMGTGLGLSIGKQLIEAHGGTIRGCNLLDNRGVVFEIILPDCVIPAPSRTVQKQNDSFSLSA
ncbi:MAG: HAMP domain-containing sensor histidine kinase [SAR324 cluster bacterium]|nr:HAMP domain-containing sensor histidine kinase [SAR324 cluster bacterium]